MFLKNQYDQYTPRVIIDFIKMYVGLAFILEPILYIYLLISSPYSSVSKGSACNAGDLGSIPGLGRSPGEGNGNPLQYSCLENPMDRGAWQITVHGVAKI